PDQIVEIFACRERQRSQRLRLIRFTIADERPDFWIFTFQKPARPQISIESRLIDRQQRTEPHRDGWKLPKIRHQIWMGIRGKSSTLGQFLSEVLQMPFINSALKKCARVNARRSVALNVDHVSGEPGFWRSEKVIK